MSSFCYQNLLAPSNKAAEKSSPYLFLTERHVQAIWLEQKYFKNLVTTSNEPIQVISPGIWNSEAGPDFLKAHIKIGSTELKGDIEIHLNEESWVQHHHDEDERYDSVILHIAFWQPKKPSVLWTKAGSQIRQAYLEPVLTVSVGRLIHLIDIDLYPYSKSSGTGRCSQKLFRSMQNEKIISLFTSAAYWRLEQKKYFLQSRAEGVSMQFALGLAMALGYKNNTQRFLELFQFLFDYRDLSFDELFAIGMGCCGFFDRKVPKKWINSDHYQYLKLIWEGRREEILHQCQIRTDKVRPYNHPLRRLAYLVTFIRDPQMEALWNRIRNEFFAFEYEDHKKKTVVGLRQKLLDHIPNYAHSYWNYHYTFEILPRKEFLALIGDDLKMEIVVNTIFPLLYDEIKLKGGVKLLNLFNMLYQSIHASVATKKRYLEQRFFGQSEKREILDYVQMEQGAYQLHKDFCLHYEASCEGCPFVERYLNVHS